jgi:transcriptional regulator with XRE-family HTH domain
MDDAKVGAAVRAVRIRKRLTQAEVAQLASVRPSAVSLLERGLFGDLPLTTLRGIAAALGMWYDITPRWRGVDLNRLVNGPHDALQGGVLRWLAKLPGWIAMPEVSFSIFGERGAIDILAWHAATQTLLIVELKTFLVEPAELVRKMHQRMRLARRIGAEQGWRPRTVAQWVIVTDTRTNRRHLAAHRALLAPLATLDGRRMRTWLRSPDGPVSALSFWSEPGGVIARRVRKPRKAE